jgi:hypothetical protein
MVSVVSFLALVCAAVLREVPTQGLEFAEGDLLQAAGDPAFPPQAGLIAEQAVQELPVEAARLVSVDQGGIQLLARDRDP